MKIIVDFKRDLHPVSQLILSLLYKKEYDLIKRYFSVVYPIHLQSLHVAGYLLSSGPYDLQKIEDLALSIPKTRKLLGEADTSEAWIDEYRLKFQGKKVGVMGSRSACVDKMNRFLEDYSFSRQTILLATDRYIGSCKQGGYSYLQRADYFIYKDETVNNSRVTTSNLATLCEEIELLGEDAIKDQGWHRTAI